MAHGEIMLADSDVTFVDSGPFEVVCRQTETEKWHAARWTGFSASVIPQLMGYDPYVTDIKELIYNHARRLSTVQDNGYMALGRYFERGVMDWAAAVHPEFSGRDVASWGELLRSKSHPFVLATPDGHCGKHLIEVKTRTAGSSAWKEGVPKKVHCQVQVQLFVTGYQEAYVIDWPYPKPGKDPVTGRFSEPKPPNLHCIKRDDAEIGRILETVEVAYRSVEMIRDREGLL